MGTLLLTLLLNVSLIITMATAYLLTEKDIGSCSTATPYDRLPHIVEPLKYSIKLNMRLHYKTITGQSSIRIRIAASTRVVALHAHGLKIDSDALILTKSNRTWAENAEDGNGNGNGNGNGKNGEIAENNDIIVEIYKPKKYHYCTTSQILEIHFDKDLHRGYYILHVAFAASFAKYKGFIQHPYLKEEMTTKWLIMTFIEQYGARKVFPCWDEPAMKAFFNISVQHSSRYRVFSNTPIRRLDKDDLHKIHVTHFHTTPAISPSLVLITMIDNIVNYPVEFAVNYIWHREETTDLLKYMSNIIEPVRRYLSLTTDVQEKKRKLNFVLIPNIPVKYIGCCGLYIYREQDVTYDENIHFSGRQVAIARLLAYNIARRWFLGLVSPSWKTDTWLGEALATFFSHYTVAKMYHDLKYLHLFVVQTLQPALRYDTVLKMQPIAEAVKSTVEINANEIDTILYSRLNYNKASTLIRMLQHFLGVPNFREGIDRYVRQYKSRSASTDDFWQVMQDVYEETQNTNYSVKEMMNTWLIERQYPIVHFKYNYSNTTATISTSCANNSSWIIPISHTIVSSYLFSNSSHVRMFRCFESQDIEDVQLEDLIIINQKQVGYYRVQYDYPIWRRISSQLRYDNYTQIHVLNRAALIDDAYYFMTTGELENSVFFDIIKYLKRETDFVAWYPMFNILSYMSNYFKLSEGKFMTPHFLDILGAVIKNVGYEKNPEDNGMKNTLRLLATRWACKLGDTECRKVANAKLNAHIKDPVANPILSWWKDWVYCMGMESANLGTWYQVLNKGMENNDMETLMYLTCSNEHSLLLYYLNFIVSNNVATVLMTEDQRFSIYRIIAKKHAQKETVLTYILRNHESIMSSFSKSITMILGDVIMNLKSPEQFDKIRDFAKHFTGDKNLSDATEQLIKARQKEIKQILDEYDYI